ncbi:hypothetical protein [Anabaenopsis elenkinii]|uniref:Uncharacterized protein n=1 Tax=Anabaenopsis elenkinii CCIBt3563 TaxID=2779889 RepID=A0A7S6U6R2_9CYAN|nr:hypothetical protein [Anabaenopsis elenkinii]QOV23593.1 hypothetical protein IM676_04635 [Anabaenopsis elenkinii CCIBt3563]
MYLMILTGCDSEALLQADREALLLKAIAKRCCKQSEMDFSYIRPKLFKHPLSL